jgi:hypothetical protein
MPTRNIGQTVALMPEASTADQQSELLDGKSGDTNFPYAKFKVLATVGEIDPITKKALTGYPDGNAAWLKDNNTVRVVYQSESYATMSNETYPWVMETGVKFTGSHIHAIDYDRSKFASFLSNNSGPASEMFKASGHLFDRVFNVFGQEVKPKTTTASDLAGKWGNQTRPDGTLVEFISGSPASGSTPAVKDMRLTQGDFFFHSFCGSFYETANKYGKGIGFADDVWLMGEEWNIGNSMFADPDGSGPLKGFDVANGTMGLASMVVDVKNEVAYTAPALGQAGYEKLLPMNSGHQDYVLIVASGYNHDINPAPLKVYVGRKNFGADGKLIDQNSSSVSERDKFLARNGLLYGQLYGMALDASTYSTLGISAVDADSKMLDAYLVNANAPTSFSARYYPTSYRWDGFGTPEAVKDTEVFRWAQDGDTVNGVKEANAQPTGYTFSNSDTKVEHSSVDPDTSKTRYIQNHTASGGLLGVDFQKIKQEIAANDLDKNGLPDYLSANVTRILSGANGALKLDTGNKGVGHYDATLNPNSQTAEEHIKANKFAMVSPDGLLWAKSSDADVLIIDEDSGNDFGERKFALRIDPQTLSVLPDATGYFLAQAGGTKNPRALAKVAANAGDFQSARNSEFSGSWDVTALVTRKEDGSFYTVDELKGNGHQLVEQSRPLDEHVFIGVLQQSSESGGAVKENKADYGGQIFQFSIDIPTGIPVYRLHDTKDGSHFFTTNVKERDALTGQNHSYEAVAFNLPSKGTQALHRFHNSRSGGHLFTANETEKASLIANPQSGLVYEGVAGNVWAAGSAVAGSTPVYRLFNSQSGHHHFTVDQAERSALLGGSSNWTDEGIGFNV